VNGDLIPPRYRTAVYAVAAVVAVVLVVAELTTGIDAEALIARAGFLFVALVAFWHRPTRRV
jgi:hypothetical protein